jgi:hypothetical protein
MINMRIFGKERQSLKVKAIRAVRAMYVNGDDTQEIEIHFITEDGERLDLQIPWRLAYNLVGDLKDAYEAINPPLSSRNNRSANWDFDMGDNG